MGTAYRGWNILLGCLLTGLRGRTWLGWTGLFQYLCHWACTAGQNEWYDTTLRGTSSISTYLRIIVGILFNSAQVFILFLAVAVGAIICVVAVSIAKRIKLPAIVMWGRLIGFPLGYATDLIVTYAGA